MKKKLLAMLSLVVITTALFAGCSMLYDESVGDNIGPYVDPLNNPNTDFLPDSNADPAEEEADDGETAAQADDNGIIELGEGHIRQTILVLAEEPGDEGEEMKAYYVTDDFKVFIPFRLRKALQVEIRTTVEDDYEVTYYDFFFVPEEQQADPPLEAKALSIKVAPYDYYRDNRSSISATAATPETDKPVYILMELEEGNLPEGFPDVEGFIDIQNVFINMWDFQLIEEDASAA